MSLLYKPVGVLRGPRTLTIACIFLAGGSAPCGFSCSQVPLQHQTATKQHALWHHGACCCFCHISAPRGYLLHINKDTHTHQLPTHLCRSKSQVSCSALPASLRPPNSNSCCSCSCSRAAMSRLAGLLLLPLLPLPPGPTGNWLHCQSTCRGQQQHNRPWRYICHLRHMACNCKVTHIAATPPPLSVSLFRPSVSKQRHLHLDPELPPSQSSVPAAAPPLAPIPKPSNPPGPMPRCHCKSCVASCCVQRQRSECAHQTPACGHFVRQHCGRPWAPGCCCCCCCLTECLVLTMCRCQPVACGNNSSNMGRRF